VKSCPKIPLIMSKLVVISYLWNSMGLPEFVLLTQSDYYIEYRALPDKWAIVKLKFLLLLLLLIHFAHLLIAPVWRQLSPVIKCLFKCHTTEIRSISHLRLVSSTQLNSMTLIKHQLHKCNYYCGEWGWGIGNWEYSKQIAL